MANKTNEILSSIKTDTEKIYKERESFGPKLPSKDENTDNNENINNSFNAVLKVLCGSFSQLVSGKSGVKDLSGFESNVLNATTNTIFTNVEYISSVLNKPARFGKDFAAGFVANPQIKKLIDSLSGGANKSGQTAELTINGDDDSIKHLVWLLESLADSELDISDIDENLNYLVTITGKDGKIHQILENISQLGKFKIEKHIETINNTNKLWKAIGESFKSMPGLFMLIGAYFKSAVAYGALKNISEVLKVIKELPKVSNSSLTQITAAIDVCQRLAGMNKNLAIINKLTDNMSEDPDKTGLVKLTASIVTAINKFNEIDVDEKKIELTKNIFKSFLKLVVGSVAMLLFAGLMMHFINIEDLILFTTTLTIFIGALMFIYIKSANAIKKAFEPAESFVELVFVSGTILIYGSLFMKFINIVDILKFILAENIFISMLLYTYINVANDKDMKNAFEGMDKFTNLVAVSGIILIFGSLLSKLISWEDLGKFILGLTGFMLGMALGIWAVQKPLEKAGKTLHGFGILLLAAGATMIFGSMLFKYVDWGSLFGFSISLLLFMTGMTLSLCLLKGPVRIAKDTGKEFSKIMVNAAAILLFGGLFFTLFPGVIGGTVQFALIFSGFIFAISTSLAKFQQKDKHNKFEKIASKIALIVLLTGGLLLFAGWLMSKHPSMPSNILMFTVCLGGLIVALTGILYYAGKKENELKKGIPILLVIVGCLVISTIAMKKLAEGASLISAVGGTGTFLLVTGAMMAALGIIALGIYGLSHLLKGPQLAFILVAIGVIASAAAVLLIVSKAVVNIAESIKTLSEIKDFDISPLITNISSLMAIITAMAPLARHAFQIMKISISLMVMTKMMGDIAEAVKNYASLKIPVYLGKKIVRYRQLKDTDFKDAARNVSVIITTLGDAIIKTYNKNPEIFETNLFGRSKFSIVARSLKNLGPLISSIAKAVQQYASMLVPDVTGGYDNKHRRWNRYVQLNDNDFKNAAKNVSLIISTLGNAIIDTYDKKPELFETNLFGRSKFTKVTKSLKSLGPMIAGIASSVQRYASLLIPEVESGWNEKQKRWNSYRQLTDDDFQSAARNISLIISTLGQGIINAYTAHPDYYDDGAFGGLLGSSPFVKTVKSNIMLGKLISSIAHGVHMYANMLVPDFENGAKWNEKEKRWSVYRQLTDDDFKNASKNIQHILSTLGQAMIDTYNANKDMYTPDFLRTETPFSKVIKSNERLGNLISSIAQGVSRFANMRVPDIDAHWDEKNNRWSSYKTLEKGDFTKASNCIKEVLEILGKSIIETYNDNKKMYDESSGFLGIGAKKAPINIAIEANKRLANIISSISKSVMDMAAGKIEIDWDPKTGKATNWEHLKKEHFTLASKNINEIISTLGKTIINTYLKNPSWFDEGEDSIFGMACKAIGSMGEMIGNIATGMQSYANLRFPIKYNEEGKPIDFEKLDSEKIDEAKTNISDIITSLGQTIINEYKKHKDWFDDGEDSIFGMACKAIGSMGEMIGNIAEGIQSYAELKFPTGFDKDGKPLGYRELDKTDFDNASNNIGLVVSTLGRTILNIYDGKDYEGNPIPNLPRDLAKQMFDVPHNIFGSQSGDNKFTIVAHSLMELGNLLTTIAGAIRDYSELNVPTGWNPDGTVIGYRTLTDTDFTNAATNIGTIVTTIGNAILDLYNNPNAKEMFKIPKAGFWGAKVPTGEPNKFVVVAQSMMMVADIISTMAQGIKDYANMQIPTGWKPDGTVIGYRKLLKTDFDTAKYRISDIMTYLSRTMALIYAQYSPMFKDNSAQKVASSMYTIGKAISSISQGIMYYASLRIPVFDENGNIIKTREVKDTDFTNATDHINSVMITVAKAIYEISKDPMFILFKPGLETVMSIYEKIGTVLPNLATGVQMFASMTFPVYKDGKIVDRKILTPFDRIMATFNIGLLLRTIGNTIIDTVKNNEEIFGKYSGVSSILNDPKKSPAYALALTIGEITKPIGELAKVVGYYATGQFPIETGIDKNGNKTFKLVEVKFDKVKDNIGSLFDSILEPLKTKLMPYKNEILGLNNTKTKSIDLLKGLTLIITELGNTTTEYAKVIQQDEVKDTQTKISNLNTLIGGIKSSMDELNKISSAITEATSVVVITTQDILSGNAQSKYDNAKSSNNNSITSKLGNFVQNLRQIVDIANYAKESGSDGYDTLTSGLSNIVSEINNATSNDNFDNTVDTLDKYVKTVNKVDLTKIIQLRGLTESLNMLASRLGNLDNLTETLANQISSVLNKLIIELKEAQQTIKDVDALHEKRKKLVNESVKTIKEIMDQKMTVEVKPGVSMSGYDQFSGGGLGTTTQPQGNPFNPSNPSEDITTNNDNLGDKSKEQNPDNNQFLKIPGYQLYTPEQKTLVLEKFVRCITDSIKPDGTIDIKQLKNKTKYL